MSYEFYLRHLNRAGTVQKGHLRPVWFALEMARYGGAVNFGVRADDTSLATFTDFDLVEVWWRNLSLGIQDTTTAGGEDFVRLFTGIFREDVFDTGGDNITRRELICVSPWKILNWRRIMWPTKQNRFTSFTSEKTETMGKSLVDYNATSLATVANGRWRAGDLAGMGFPITVETDGTNGASRSREYNANTKLGDAVIALGRGDDSGDFTLVRDGDDVAWTFGWVSPPDKYDTVIFSTDRKNMQEPKLTRLAVGRGTTAVCGGVGKDDAQMTGTADADDYAAMNDVEFYVDGGSQADSTGLDERAGEALYEQRGRRLLDFKVAQTADTFFSNVAVAGRKTYTIGDEVQAQYQGTFRRVVEAVRIEMGAGVRVPNIEVITADV